MDEVLPRPLQVRSDRPQLWGGNTRIPADYLRDNGARAEATERSGAAHGHASAARIRSKPRKASSKTIIACNLDNNIAVGAMRGMAGGHTINQDPQGSHHQPTNAHQQRHRAGRGIPQEFEGGHAGYQELSHG